MKKILMTTALATGALLGGMMRAQAQDAQPSRFVAIAQLQKVAATASQKTECAANDVCRSLNLDLSKISLVDQMTIIEALNPAEGMPTLEGATGPGWVVGPDGRPVVSNADGAITFPMLQLAGKVRAGELLDGSSPQASGGDVSSLSGRPGGPRSPYFSEAEDSGAGKDSATLEEKADQEFAKATEDQADRALDIGNQARIDTEEKEAQGLFSRGHVFVGDGDGVRGGNPDAAIFRTFADLVRFFGASVVSTALPKHIRDEDPNAVAARPVTPEIQAAVQQLIAKPQGGVKGGQIDPIEMKDAQTTQSPDAATKPAVSAQQKAQLLNRAKFGSGFAAPVGSRNGGGGMPTEVGAKVGSPMFTNSGTPASPGCGAGRVCR